MSSPHFASVVRAVGLRSLKKTARRPVALTFSLAQPLLWMTLFGFLFQRFDVTTLHPGLRYLDFLVPGVACMTCLFGASQSGIELVRDLQTGFLPRMLGTPAPRAAVLLGKLLADSSRLVLQAVVVVALGMLLGARLAPSAEGIAVGAVALFAFTFAFACVSCALGCIAKAPEGMAAFVHVVNMPLLFTSTALVPSRAMPPALGWLAEHNPLSATADALRAGLVLGGSAPLAGSVVSSLALAVVAFAVAHRALSQLGPR